MAKLKYYYNPQTFQYDPVKRNVWGVVWYVLGLVFTSIILFSGIFFIDNLLYETDYEAQLRFENKSLKKHKTLLTSQLESMEQTLTELKKEDTQLYSRIFNIQSEQNENIPAHDVVSSDLEYANLSGFRKNYQKVQSQSADLFKHSKQSNTLYKGNQLSAEELNKLAGIPTVLPVDVEYVPHLVSGFGERINPFHKGNYQHPGLDFSLPRGSRIYATAAGRIISTKKSDLQAGYGNYIEIDHGNGYITRYAHMEDLLVRVGQSVGKGDQIGTSGMSGGSISPHLHYEVIRYNENIDPVAHLIQGISPEQYADLVAMAKLKNQSLD